MPAEPVPQEAGAEYVHDGLFFTLPDVQPRGRQNLTHEQITQAQRERLLAAVTELLAARGYRGFGVGDIATRAGVSFGTFYDCFDDPYKRPYLSNEAIGTWAPIWP